MYSCRLLQRAAASASQAFEELGEVGPGELPFERRGEGLVVGLEGEDPGGELLDRGGSGRVRTLRSRMLK
jgi:hypothetical protein